LPVAGIVGFGSVRITACVNFSPRQFTLFNANRIASTYPSNADPMCPTGA